MLNFQGDLWIDGSYVSEKPEPDDVDVILWADPEVTELRQVEMIRKLSRTESEGFPRCHTFAFIKPAVESGDWTLHDDPQEWLETFGSDRDNNPKGIVTVQIRKGLKIKSLIEKLV